MRPTLQVLSEVITMSSLSQVIMMDKLIVEALIACAPTIMQHEMDRMTEGQNILARSKRVAKQD